MLFIDGRQMVNFIALKVLAISVIVTQVLASIFMKFFLLNQT